MSDINASKEFPVVRLFSIVDRKWESNIASGKWRCLFWDHNFENIGQSPITVFTDTLTWAPYKNE
jgi:hypothetical protein